MFAICNVWVDRDCAESSLPTTTLMSLDEPSSPPCASSGGDRPGSVDADRLEAQLPAGPVAPATARALVAAAAAGLPDTVVDRAQLAASELVTNAVRHGADPGAPIWIRIAVTARGLRLEVIDRGRSDTRRADSAGGFGIGIVSAVADSVQWFREPAWRVIAELCAGGAAAPV